MADDDPNVKALRSAGHDDAADLLERVAQERARAEAARTKGPAALPLLDALPPVEAQRRREGQVLLDGMTAAGIGGGWVSGGDLMDGEQR